MTGRAILLSPLADWRAEPVQTEGMYAGAALRLGSGTDGPFVLGDPAGTFGGLTDPTGGAVDCEGRAYRLCGGRLEFYSCPGWSNVTCLGGLNDPHGLTVTPTGDVVVVETGAARLLVLAAEAVTIRRIIGGPTGWQPFDVAWWRGRLLVSDPTHGVVHVMSCHGAAVADWDGASQDDEIAPFEQPTAIAVDLEDRVYVLDAANGTVHVFDRRGDITELRHTTESIEDRFCAPLLTVDDAGDVALVTETPAAEAVFNKSGTYVSTALDSRRHRCVWHRVRLIGQVPPGTNVQVFTATADLELLPAELAAMPADRWSGGQVHGTVAAPEWDCLVLSPPGRYLWLRLEFTGSGAATPRLNSVWVEHPRITSAQLLPAVYRDEPASADFTERFMSIIDATMSSVDREIDSLPSLLDPYAAPASASTAHDFLGYLASWLGIAEELRLPEARLRQLVARAHELYRLRGTPAGILLHLLLAVGRRAHILEDFAMRRWLYVGTARLDDCATLWGEQVVARLQLDTGARIGTSALVGSTDPLRDPFHVNAHRFEVYLTVRHGEDEGDLIRLATRVVELAKPAHTDARLVLVHPRMRLGVQSYLGVDSVVAAYPIETREGESRLGYDSVLSASSTRPTRPSLRIGQTTRIGTTTVLD
jgi:phage tail-like protein